MSYRWNDIDAFLLRRRTINDAIPAMLERPSCRPRESSVEAIILDGTLPLRYARIGAPGEGDAMGEVLTEAERVRRREHLRGGGGACAEAESLSLHCTA
jgi:hypothetical protein